MSNKLALQALAMDLKRAALGYHTGSLQTAVRFSQEALKRKEEIDLDEIKPYLRQFLLKLPQMLSQKDAKQKADDALMYSTILQNYALTFI